MTAVTLSIQILLYVALGYLAQKLHLVDDKFGKSLSSLLLNITLPCTIVNSLCIPFAPDALKSCGVMLGLSVLWLALSFLLAQLIYQIGKRSPTAKIFRFGAIFVNFTFIGMMVSEALYGSEGLFYYVVFTVPIRMLFYTLAKPMLAPPSEERPSLGKVCRGFLTPPVIAVFVGLVLYLTQLQLPEVLSGVISSVGAVSSPMGMILCGITLAKYTLKEVAKPRYLLLPLYRNLLAPAIALALGLLLGVEPILAKILVIYAACPVASMLTAFTIQYAHDPAMELDASGSVFLSTVCCAVTIPLWSWILELVF